MSSDDLYAALLRFHREVALPDVQRAVRNEVEALRDELRSHRSDTLSHFDAMYQRFDHLDSEYHALASAVGRLETRSVSGAELQREIDGLKSRMKVLEQRIADLEAESQ